MAIVVPAVIKSFSGQYLFLSNFFTQPREHIKWMGYEFYSVEHAYQASKCSDKEVMKWFVVGACLNCHHQMTAHLQSEFRCPDKPNFAMNTFQRVRAGDAKRIGKRVRLRSDWEQEKLQIMLDLLRIKFSEPELRKKLLETRQADLIEGNTWGDTYWGVCYGTGKNMLGVLLMQVRAELVKQDVHRMQTKKLA